jgi:hypothetical protein
MQELMINKPAEILILIPSGRDIAQLNNLNLLKSYLISWCVLLISSTADDVLRYAHYYFMWTLISSFCRLHSFFLTHLNNTSVYMIAANNTNHTYVDIQPILAPGNTTLHVISMK